MAWTNNEKNRITVPRTGGLRVAFLGEKMSKIKAYHIETKNKTTEELIKEHIIMLAKHYDSGPIVGEKLDIIYELSWNIMARDALLASMGVKNTEITHFLKCFDENSKKRDKEILEKRKKSNQSSNPSHRSSA